MKYFCFVVLLAGMVDSFGQDTIRRELKIRTKSYARTECFVEGYKTDGAIVNLFKPGEIIMRREHSAQVSSDSTFIMKISVKDPEHPVLKYFQHKASMLINSKLLPHNVIPRLTPNRISDVVFHDNAGEGAADVLEVVFYGEEYHSNDTVRHTTEKKRVKYYDLDGKVYTNEEVRKMRLKPGQLKTLTILFGKEAAEKYGDPKYADGIVIGTIK